MTREGGVAGGGARNNRWLIYTKCSWRGATVSSAQLYVWFTIRALWVGRVTLDSSRVLVFVLVSRGIVVARGWWSTCTSISASSSSLAVIVI